MTAIRPESGQENLPKASQDKSATRRAGSRPYVGQANTSRSGWTVGGGLEYAFLPNWSAFVEYNYINLGSRNEQLTYGCGSICVFPGYIFPNPYTFTVSHNISEVLFGLNYRFGWLAAGH